MLRLLTIEFHKLKYNRASRILTIIYFALLISIALFAAIRFDFGNFEFHLADMGIFDFPYIWHFNTYMAAIFKFFLLMVIVSMMANEYSNKTLKQNLIDGLSKKEFILSKFYMVLTLAVISTLFVFITSMILGLIFSSYDEMSIIFSDLEFILAFFIKLVAFFSLGLFMGIFVRRSAFAVGGILVLFFVELIFKGYLSYHFRDADNTLDKINSIMRYFPLESMSNLIKQPFTRLNTVKGMAKQVGADVGTGYGVHWYEFLIPVIWTGIFIFLSYRLLLKRDL
ncbi:ABC transporter permease [Flavobacteriaceae bacterium F08102]|nr:ABC transporter permease [Flavobacteriaceae bacterium F08102]